MKIKLKENIWCPVFMCSSDDHKNIDKGEVACSNMNCSIIKDDCEGCIFDDLMFSQTLKISDLEVEYE